MTDVDLIVIGSGPAGIATATTAATHGLSVALLDEQASAGGQIYRSVADCNDEMLTILGDDYRDGKELISQLSKSTVTFITGATVWHCDRGGRVTFSRNGTAQQIHAKEIVIASGAIERSFPIPGWTIPGVMTVGAAQVLLKSNQLGIENAVLAGTGPLLYTVAKQLLNANCPPKAIIDTISTKHYLQAAPRFPFSSIATIKKGLSALRFIKKSGVPFYTSANRLEIIGAKNVEAIQFHCNQGDVTVETNNVLLHQGVVPNTQLSQSLGLKHLWNARQHCFHVVVDQWGMSSAPNIRIAGDGSGIGGAIVAELQGKVIALGVLESLGYLTRQQRNTQAATLQNQLSSQAALRTFLDLLYEPPASALLPEDSTIVCRCEEVTAGDIRAYTKIGCSGPNQTKAFGRCGMGPCQGRYCGLTVNQILACENKLSHDEVGYYRIRSPIKPVTLSELASLDTAETKATEAP